MPTDVLTLRALNRALLARQMLLRPAPLPPGPGRAGAVIAMVEHLGGLQAQAPFPPYYGLWSRLAGFQPGDLAELLVTRQVVRIALMRSTIHLVSARDCLTFRPLLQPMLDRALPAIFRDRFAGLDTAALAAAGRAAVDAEPRTFSELGGLLAPDWPGHPASALAQGVRVLVPLVQVPPRAVWGSAGQSRHTSAEAWLGRSLDPSPPPEALITRYLGAFGPATVADVQTWSGLTRLAEVVNRLRPGLRSFRDEQGRELFDLPEAPRPGPDTPAPVRLVAEFDNLILSHADRTRVVSSANRPRLSSLNGIFPGTVLVDGFVAGMWRLTRSRRSAVLSVELFGPVSAGDRDAIAAAGGRLLGFAAAGDDHELRFAPLA
jgi:hypothetical protein